MIQINEPIWKTKSIGISEYKLPLKGKVNIEILYKDKKGERVFPFIYQMEAEEIRKYPRDKKHRFLFIIPIINLEIKS